MRRLYSRYCWRKDDDDFSTWPGPRLLCILPEVELAKAGKLFFWTDNCLAQNKCWTLYTALCSLINSPDLQLDTITVKYLEPGHTFMSADSFHHREELSIKQCGQLHTYEDFVGVVEKVGAAIVSKSAKIGFLLMLMSDMLYKLVEEILRSTGPRK